MDGYFVKVSCVCLESLSFGTIEAVSIISLGFMLVEFHISNVDSVFSKHLLVYVLIRTCVIDFYYSSVGALLARDLKTYRSPLRYLAALRKH